MRILFVTFNFNSTSISGGFVVSSRNFQSLKEIPQTQLIIEYPIKRKISKTRISRKFDKLKDLYIDFANLSFGGLDRKQELEIFELISLHRINVVFLDSSLLGNLAKHIKNKFESCKVITFFHNFEYLFQSEQIKFNRSYHLFYRKHLSYINEKNACIFSDYTIAINKRDQVALEKKYRTKISDVIPVSLKDDNSINKEKVGKENIPIGLFVGSNFYANRQGIIWFCKNVLPFVRMKLYVVGRGMNHLKKFNFDTTKIEIYDRVEDLEYYYYKSDFVVIPIFVGSGMKVKTAEALMYGKFIFATNEAVSGYEIGKECGIICNTKEEFVSALNSFNMNENVFNYSSRQLFLDKYSYEATLINFYNLFDKVMETE